MCSICAQALPHAIAWPLQSVQHAYLVPPVHVWPSAFGLRHACCCITRCPALLRRRCPRAAVGSDARHAAQLMWAAQETGAACKPSEPAKPSHDGFAGQVSVSGATSPPDVGADAQAGGPALSPMQKHRTMPSRVWSTQWTEHGLVPVPLPLTPHVAERRPAQHMQQAHDSDALHAQVQYTPQLLAGGAADQADNFVVTNSSTQSGSAGLQT